MNKNSTNVTKMQKEQLLQQIIDQQTVENQKQTMEFLHANKGVEALGVLVQYLVFNVSTMLVEILPHLHSNAKEGLIVLLMPHEYLCYYLELWQIVLK